MATEDSETIPPPSLLLGHMVLQAFLVWVFWFPFSSIRELSQNIFGYDSIAGKLGVTLLNSAFLLIQFYLGHLVLQYGKRPDQRESYLQYLAKFYKGFILVLLWFGLAGNLLLGRVRIGSWMSPTLREGDLIAYSTSSYMFSEPKRGDIVVVKFGHDDRTLGRIIGLPGEQVTVTSGHVLINGEPLIEDYLGAPIVGDSWNPFTLDSGMYTILNDQRIPKRTGYLVKREDIVGKAFLRYAPLLSIGLLPEPHFSDEKGVSSRAPAALHLILQMVGVALALLILGIVVLMGWGAQVGRNSRNKEQAANELLSLGRLYQQRGAQEAARSAFEIALSKAKTTHLSNEIKAALLTGPVQVSVPQPHRLMMNDSKISPVYLSPGVYPSNAALQLKKAIDAYRQHELEQALGFLHKAIEANPDPITEVQIQRTFGAIYVDLDNWRAAIDACKAAIRLNPKDPYSYHNLGVAFLQVGNRREAKKAFRDRIRLSPQDAVCSYYELGLLALKEGKTGIAKSHFRRVADACQKEIALDLVSKPVQYAGIHAIALAVLGDLVQAGSLLRTVLQDPECDDEVRKDLQEDVEILSKNLQISGIPKLVDLFSSRSDENRIQLPQSDDVHKRID